MLGNGEVCADAWLRHDKVATDLATHLPASFLEGLGRVFARDVREPAQGAILTILILLANIFHNSNFMLDIQVFLHKLRCNRMLKSLPYVGNEEKEVLSTRRRPAGLRPQEVPALPSDPQPRARQ